jgi:DNA-binding MarR family transcriptional regulator
MPLDLLMAQPTRSRARLRAAQQQRRPPAPVRLDFFLPFLITREAGRIVAHFNKATAWTDLTLADAQALGAIWYKPDIRLVELARTTDIDLSTLSRLVRRLERRKLCVITTRNSDARVGTIRLSSKGLDMIRRFATVGLGIEAQLERELSASEAAQLKKLLRKASVELS